MGRRRERSVSSTRRRETSDRRLRGLSPAERRRVYRRRRIVALLILVVILLAIAVLAGLISLPLAGAGASGVQGEKEIPRLDARSSSSRAAEARGPDAAQPAQEAIRGTDLPEGTKPAGNPEETAGRPLDVLVLGVDRRPEGSAVEGSRADTIMVARVFPGTGSVKILSIPRDLFVEIEPGVEDRINAAYSYGGVEQITGAVERTTGTTVDRYAVVDFEGFVDIVDAVGGLTVEIQGEMPPPGAWREPRL